MEPLFSLKSFEIFRMFVGHAAESVERFVQQVEAVGGLESFIDGNEIYSRMNKTHRDYAAQCYESLPVREAVANVRTVVGQEGIVTPEAAWYD
jgi:hypothetical protein